MLIEPVAEYAPGAQRGHHNAWGQIVMEMLEAGE